MHRTLLVSLLVLVAGAIPAAAEHWVATHTSDAFGLSQDYVDRDSVGRHADKLVYYRVKSVMDLGTKKITTIDSDAVDCSQDMAGDYTDITLRELKKDKQSGQEAWTDTTLSAGSGGGQVVRFVCQKLMHVAPKKSTLTANEKALCSAADKGSVDDINRLAGLGTNVNILCDPYKEPPLRPAAANGHVDAVAALLAQHAAVDGRDRDGATALMSADSPAVADALIAAGADVSARNKKGQTPLIAIAMVKQPDKIADVLIAHGADVNATSNDGGTALMSAADVGALALVQLLLDHGANIETRDKQGRSALAWAKSGKVIFGFAGAMTGRKDLSNPSADYDAIVSLLQSRGLTQ